MEADVQEAITLLETWPALGVVERYEQSLHLIERTYGDLFPALRLRPEHANRTSAAQDEARIRREIGEDLFREFETQNHLDYRLYQYALDRFTELWKDLGA